MNWQIVLGLLLIAVGSLLTLVGGRTMAQRDSKPLEEKVQQVLTRIDEVRASADTTEGQARLDRIGEEFLTWAKQFGENRVSKRLEFEEARLRSSAQRFANSRVARPVIAFGVSVLRKSIDAYNANAERHITYEFPNLPENLSSTDTMPWQGAVVFADDVAWNVRVPSVSPLSAIPELLIDFGKKPNVSEPRLDFFLISIEPTKGRVECRLFGTRIPDIDGIRVDLALSDYETGLRSSLQRLLETQLLLLDEPQATH
jgi:hypothetical protein